MQIRIEGYDLPGRTCAGSPDFPGYRDVHVAVQRRNRRDELYGLHPGDAPGASWTLDCVATPATDQVADGAVDITGPYVQGGRGARFVYLSWGTVDPGGAFTLFRRAKLILAAIPPDVATAALTTGLLTARLRLTDAKGHPLCARVVPPWVSWTA
ncbi:hypothetical protein ABIA33_000059 [Streptacidiphilus sp. MAP12-16]|uniref:DUF5990 family protein n=1 Tax=Streptacidiphilus sp. MAP12-16 TaxID=3156300 RepID=UPI00351102E4